MLVHELDEYHPNRANGYMNVGVGMTQDDPKEAIRMLTAALDIRLGSDKFTAIQIHGLALNYLNIGRAWWMVKAVDEARRVPSVDEAKRA